MKFFHLSDLHIGLKLINRDLREDQEYILHQITELAAQEQPDAVVIAGDIYDKAIPSAEAVDVFDKFITELTAAVPEAEIMMISGNHDSASRVNVFRSVLERQHIHMIGMPPQLPGEHIEKVTLTKDEYGPVNFYLLPFVKPSMIKLITGTDENGNNLSYDRALHSLIGREEINQAERNVLVSHQFYLPAGMQADRVERMDSEVRTAGNIDEVGADILEAFDYAALGHIHKPMKVGSDYFRYCGTPLACSVSEAGQQKGVIMVELGKKTAEATENTDDKTTRASYVTATVLPLTPLRQVRIIRDTLAEVLRQPSSDYVTVILTDENDLDVIDAQDRLHFSFPNLLEIRRENQRLTDYSADNYTPEKEMDMFELCSAFLGADGENSMSEEEQALLRDVIGHVQGVL